MPKAVKQTKKKTVRRKPITRSNGQLLGSLVPFESRGELKVLVYGDSGTGKTVFWSSFPKPILAILCSGGRGTNELDSAEACNLKGITPYYLGDPSYGAGYGTGSCDDLLTLAEELQSDNYYSTIVIDHWTGIQDLRIAEILGLDEIPVQKNWGMASREKYGERSVNMKKYLRGFMDLVDKKVVFVCQELVTNVEPQSDLDILPHVSPALSDSVRDWLEPAANYIIRTFIKQRTEKYTTKLLGKEVEQERDIKGEFDYCLMTGPSDIYKTKFRLPPSVKKPEYLNVTGKSGYDEIMKLIEGKSSPSPIKKKKVTKATKKK